LLVSPPPDPSVVVFAQPLWLEIAAYCCRMRRGVLVTKLKLKEETAARSSVRSRKRAAINGKFQKGSGLSGFKGDSLTSEALELCVKAADDLIGFNTKVQRWLAAFASSHSCSSTHQLQAGEQDGRAQLTDSNAPPN
jgi:hypothetical protein